jgi:hypothetical protein
MVDGGCVCLRERGREIERWMRDRWREREKYEERERRM